MPKDGSGTYLGGNDWMMRVIEPNTQCKHGKGDCAVCGTSNRRDVIHTSTTPNKRDARRARKKAKK